MNCTVLADHRVKLKESEVSRPFLKTKKIWNMKVTVKPIVIGVLSRDCKG